MSCNRLYLFKFFLATLTIMMIILLSPRLHADFGVFGVGESTLVDNYSQESSSSIDRDSGISSLSNLDSFRRYLWALQPELGISSLEDVDLSLFERYVSEDQTPLLETQKGWVVGQYNLLPADWMELVLYQSDEPQGVFGLSSLKDEEDLSPSANFSIEAQSTLLNGLTVFYGYDASDNLNLSEQLSLNDNSKLISQKAGLEFNLFPGMLVNADYIKSLVGSSMNKAHTRLQLAYNPASFASFNAGVGIISKEDDSFGMDLLPAWFSTSDNKSYSSNLDDVIVRELGLAVQPTTFSSLSADYVSLSGKDEQYKAVFGLKLGDKGKEVNATYKMENQESSKTTSAGLELGLVDLATLKAVYGKVENLEVTEETLKSFLDLGLDLNLADWSVLRFQYKWVLPEEVTPSDETTAEARLEVRF